MEQFIQAVLIFHSPSSSPQQRKQAEDFITNLQQKQDIHKFGIQLIQTPAVLQHPQSFYICFHAMNLIKEATHPRANIDVNTKRQLISFLLKWSLTFENQLIVNKAIQNAFLMMINNNCILPNEWPVFLLEVMNQLKTTQHNIVFLKMIQELNDDLIEKAKNETSLHDLSNAVKDAFRANGIQQIVLFLYNCMSKQETVVDALQNFAPLIEWIDISFSTQQDFIQQMFSFLKYPELYHHVLTIFTKIIEKGMPPENKLAIISSLNLINKINFNQIKPSDEENFAAVTKLSASTLSILLKNAEKMFPKAMVCRQPQQVDQNTFNKIIQLVLEYFNMNIIIFGKSPLDNFTDTSTVIVETINQFLGSYLNLFIQPATLSQPIINLLQSLFNKYNSLINSDCCEDENDENFKNYTTSLKNVYRAIVTIDGNFTNIQIFLNQLLQLNKTNPNKQSVGTHAYLLIHFPDILFKDPNVKQYMNGYMNQFAQIVVPILENSGNQIPIISALERFVEFISPEVLVEVMNKAVQVVQTGKCLKEIQKFSQKYRSVKAPINNKWSESLAKCIYQIGMNFWNTHNQIDISILYSILSDLSEHTLKDVVNLVFIPEIENCQKLIGNNDITFVTAYIDSRLRNACEFLKKNSYDKRPECSPIFAGYCPIINKIMSNEFTIDHEVMKKTIVDFIQSWINGIGPHLTQLPSLPLLYHYLTDSHKNSILLGNLLIHLSNVQMKLDIQIIGNDYITILQNYMNQMNGTDQLDPRNDYFRERIELLKIILNMLQFPFKSAQLYDALNYQIFIANTIFIVRNSNEDEVLKMLIKYAYKMIEIHIASNAQIGNASGFYFWFELITMIVKKTKANKMFSLTVDISSLMKSLVKLNTNSQGIVMQLTQRYLNMLSDNEKEFTINFFTTFLNQIPNNISSNVVRKYLIGN